MMECPEVQPPAYLVPNPTRNPPITVKMIPLTENRAGQLNRSLGISPAKSFTPWLLICCTRVGSTWLLGPCKKTTATTPPSRMPATKKRFQASLFHLYLKNGISAGKQAAQICLSEDDTPKRLLPIISSRGTMSPIRGPATYQGHGDAIERN